ncbi:RNA polymerase sigma-70 factor [Nesterenkonia ebinurensis]|uniref:RNA polymerase sigma-70 factor n=1 Tax=Nesterenkonia ebinurensis TaxID=2608252 RepID=UPI00123DC209|nr:RNA polymerase sigma-70 factor [Nesterenkonia ebinurensis]
MTQTEDFEALRPLLFSIAYRMLGSVGEAEDAVQETWLRYTSSSTEPDSLKAYLSTVVTRISIDVLQSARVRRETYIGPWFPEPLPTDSLRSATDDSPEQVLELADTVSAAALLLLERLSPLERAVFVLREVFGLEYQEIATAVDRSEAACRQLASRARRHMQQELPRFDADPQQQAELAQRFFNAIKEGEIDQLKELLAAEVEALNDSGGAGGGQGGVYDVERAARFLVSGVSPLFAIGASLQPQEFNGQPGAILRDRTGGIICTWTLEILDGRIHKVRSMSNPEKLSHLGGPADLHTLAQERSQARRRERKSSSPGLSPSPNTL